MPFLLEDCRTYQKALVFADRVTSVTELFPRGKHYLADQLNRAALSISTNIAEGNGRHTQKDRRNFFVIARGSVQECLPILEVAKRTGLLEARVHADMTRQLEIIAKMLSGLLRKK